MSNTRSKQTTDLTKLSSDTQFLIKYLEEKLLANTMKFEDAMKANTEQILKKIEEKDKKISALEKEVSSLKSHVSKLEKSFHIQQFELDELKFASNKGFHILSGKGIQHSGNNIVDSIKTTIHNKLQINIESEDITEASKITAKNNSSDQNAVNTLYKFKLPYAVRTEIIQKLAELKPNIYLNEALSPLKRSLLKKATDIKTALPDRIKSVYYKNGILRINEINGNSQVNIRNQAELDEYLLRIDFNPEQSS